MVRLWKGHPPIETHQPHEPGAGRLPGRVAVFAVSAAVRRVVSLSQQYADAAGHHLGLHRSDLLAMDIISQAAQRGERLTPGDVAQRMRLSPAAVTALVDRLAKVGHLRREPDTQDRRRTRLDLSDQAVGVSLKVMRPLVGSVAHVLDRYSDEELELVTRVLLDVGAAIDTADPREADLSGTPYAHRTDPRVRSGGSDGSPGVAAPTLGDHETG